MILYLSRPQNTGSSSSPVFTINGISSCHRKFLQFIHIRIASPLSQQTTTPLCTRNRRLTTHQFRINLV
ncbi:hypothetical protein Hanom_Chr09g00856141 [Helianthus anomalus]